MTKYLLALWGAVGMAYAQTQPTPQDTSKSDLDEVVITASRWAEPLRDVPQQIVRVTPRAIELRNPQTAADALQQSGQVFVQKSQQGGGSPMLRGFTANGILLVMDGIRMNNAIFRGGNLQNSILVDPNALQSIEVLYGPGSVQYGSDALGGVIHFSTIQPEFTDQFTVQGNVFTRWSSANQERAVSATMRLSAPRWSSVTSLSVTDFGDLRMGAWRSPYEPTFGLRTWTVNRINGQDVVVPNDRPNIQVGSGYTQYNVLQKIGYRIGNRADITYSFYGTTSSDVPRYDRLFPVDAVPAWAEWYYGPQKWQLHALTLNLRQGAFYDDARLTLSYQDYEESRISRRLNRTNKTHQIESVQAYNLNLDFRKKWTKHELYYGAEGYFNDVGSRAFAENIVTGVETPAATRYPDGGSEVWSGAVYAQYVGKFIPGLSVIAGGRGTVYQLSSTFNDRTFFPFPYSTAELKTDALNGMFGLVTEEYRGVRLSAYVSTGFRAPNVDDVGKVFDSRPGTATQPGVLVVPNPDLSPERTTTVDGSVEVRRGPLRLSVHAYYSWLADGLISRPFTLNGQSIVQYQGTNSRVFAVQNVRDGYVWGLSGEVELQLNEHFRLNSQLAHNHGRDQDGFGLRPVPPLFGRTALIYREGRFDTELNAQYNGWKRLSDIPPDDEAINARQAGLGTPAWWTLNAYSRIRLTWGLSLTLACENIADWHYRTYGSGISAPGRNFIVSVRKTF